MSSQVSAPARLGRITRDWSALKSYLGGGPAHACMFTLGRFRPVSSSVVWLNSLRRPAQAQRTGVDVLEPLDVAAAVQTLRRDGLVAGLCLRPEIVTELREFAEITPCHGDGESTRQFLYGDKEEAQARFQTKFNVGRYPHATKYSPALAQLAKDPSIRNIARGYLQAEPALIGARIWWSFANGADYDQQVRLGQSYHYDIDGYRALSFFFYLTEVDATSGAHVYVRGSHRKKSMRHLVSMFKSRSDEEISRYYGAERQVTLSGSPGYGFAEDTFCFHKGRHPETRDRLMAQVRFGLRDYGTARGGF